MTSKSNPFLATTLAALVLTATSHAATLYWDGNGTDPAAAAGANDDVVFAHAGLDNTMYVSQTTGTISVRSLTFNNTGISQIRDHRRRIKEMIFPTS